MAKEDGDQVDDQLSGDQVFEETYWSVATLYEVVVRDCGADVVEVLDGVLKVLNGDILGLVLYTCLSGVQ